MHNPFICGECLVKITSDSHKRLGSAGHLRVEGDGLCVCVCMCVYFGECVYEREDECMYLCTYLNPFPESIFIDREQRQVPFRRPAQDTRPILFPFLEPWAGGLGVCVCVCVCVFVCVCVCV